MWRRSAVSLRFDGLSVPCREPEVGTNELSSQPLHSSICTSIRPTVTHDRYFLDNVAGWILEIDRGVAYPYQGNYSE